MRMFQRDYVLTLAETCREHCIRVLEGQPPHLTGSMSRLRATHVSINKRFKRCLGRASNLRGVELSGQFLRVEATPEVLDELKETILHEFAHIAAGANAGHGPFWKVYARLFGCKPRACVSNSLVAAPKRRAKRWLVDCEKCNRELHISSQKLLKWQWLTHTGCGGRILLTSVSAAQYERLLRKRRGMIE